MDASETAIEKLRIRCAEDKNAIFLCDDFTNSDAVYSNKFDYVYSRFSLHAINQEQEKSLLKNVYHSLKKNGLLFIEVRSVNDELYGKGEKIGEDEFVYDKHYRRFMRMQPLINTLKINGFSIEYAEESRGFAPWGEDDPFVIRIIAKKRNEIYKFLINGKSGLHSKKEKVHAMISTSQVQIECLKTYKTLKKKQNKVSVLFLFQMPEVWGSEELIYETMDKRDDFSVAILAIPEFEIWKNAISVSEIENENYNSIRKKYKNVINAVDINSNAWYEIGDFYDYVFYQRPYSGYLPDKYRPEQVGNNSKICYVPYAYMMYSGEVLKATNNSMFMQYIYYYFADMDFVKEYVKKEYKVPCFWGAKKIVNLGFPRFELMERKKHETSEAWSSKDAKLKIIWTPRWTVDEEMGGSNFFRYIDKIMNFISQHAECELLFRPHPMAFQNYLDKALISPDNLNDIIDFFEESSNASIDKQAQYQSSFWNSSVLVTDISSIIAEYFYTQKPIIFCRSKEKLSPIGKKIIDTAYIADSWEEVESILDNLMNGIDPLKEKRENVWTELFLNSVCGITEK